MSFFSSLCSFMEPGRHLPYSRRKLVLFLSDLGTLVGIVIIGSFLRVWFGGVIDIEHHLPLLLFLLLAPVINYFEGLYSVPPPALPEELRTLGISTSLAYFCIIIFLFLGKGDMPSRLVYVGSWLVSLGGVPLVRCRMRKVFSRKTWWRIPTVVFGRSELARRVETYLKNHPEAGLDPKGFYTSTKCSTVPEESEEEVGTRPTSALEAFADREALQAFAQAHYESCAVVVVPSDASVTCRQDIIDLATLMFPSVIIVPEDFADGEIPIWVRPVEIGEMLCLKVRQNLLDSRRLALKRCMDLVLSITGGLLLLPFFGLIGLLIRLETPGPIFFRQVRVGRGGAPIRILKFRTMVRNAEEVLQQYLAANPLLREEWAADQKLREDPRITRMGAFLRRFSLDELPQLWNVVCGEMSLVGPRPIVKEEIPRYGSAFAAYIRVRPGMTGLWQVSGRNNLSYRQRVHIDRYYIFNWSTWLDLLILARTIPAVLKREGAY